MSLLFQGNYLNQQWQILVKFSIPLFRYFYDHLSNYTETIIRLGLVNIGEYVAFGEYLLNMKGNEIDLCILHSFSNYLIVFQFFSEFVPVQI